MRKQIKICLTLFICLLAFLSCSKGYKNVLSPNTVGNNTISGHAYLSGKTDHSGINIRISQMSNATVTGTDGLYKLEGIPNGEYILIANKDGYGAFGISNIVLNSSKVNYVVNDFALQWLYIVINGKVTDSDNTPISGASVSCPGYGYSTEMLTDKNGNYAINIKYLDGIRGTTVKMETKKNGYETSSATVTLNDPGEIKQDIKLLRYDQGFDSNDVTSGGDSGYVGKLVAQSFIPSSNSIRKIKWVWWGSNFTARLEIRTNRNPAGIDLPSNTIIGQTDQTVIKDSYFGSPDGHLASAAYFSTPLSVSVGNKYWIVWRTLSGDLPLPGSSNNLYPQGNCFSSEDNGATWPGGGGLNSDILFWTLY